MENKITSFICPYCHGNNYVQIDEKHLRCSYCGEIIETDTTKSLDNSKDNIQDSTINPNLVEILNNTYYDKIDNYNPIFKEIEPTIPEKEEEIITTNANMVEVPDAEVHSESLAVTCEIEPRPQKNDQSKKISCLAISVFVLSLLVILLVTIIIILLNLKS